MEASIVDLRYKTAEILKALNKNESVTVKYHGKVKGIIEPVKKTQTLKVKEHPFFAMHKSPKQAVLEELDELRCSRHDL